MGGRVVLGRKIGQLGSGRNPVRSRQFSGPEDILPVALKTALVATKLRPE